MNLTSQLYWDTKYANCELRAANSNDFVGTWLERHVPGGDGTCFEIGCYPGRYLPIFGKRGYEIHGIDLVANVEEELPNWLSSQGFRVGELTRKDLFALDERKKYDIVCSFGLIEHFTNWEEVLVRHTKHVKPGGLLVVSTPNFRGFIQRSLRVLLDRENYRRHYIPSMQPQKWRKIVEQNGFSVKFCGYLGSFFFWYEGQSRNRIQKAAILTIRKVDRILRRLPSGNPLYSPFCGIIAQKWTL